MISFRENLCVCVRVCVVYGSEKRGREKDRKIERGRAEKDRRRKRGEEREGRREGEKKRGRGEETGGETESERIKRKDGGG